MIAIYSTFERNCRRFFHRCFPLLNTSCSALRKETFELIADRRPVPANKTCYGYVSSIKPPELRVFIRFRPESPSETRPESFIVLQLARINKNSNTGLLQGGPIKDQNNHRPDDVKFFRRLIGIKEMILRHNMLCSNQLQDRAVIGGHCRATIFNKILRYNSKGGGKGYELYRKIFLSDVSGFDFFSFGPKRRFNRRKQENKSGR